MNIGHVYLITCLITNKKYIGSTKRDVKVRQQEHISKRKSKLQVKLYNSFNKYGYENHSFECVWSGDLNDMYKMERVLGDQYNVLDKKLGLNLKLPGYDEVPPMFSAEMRKRVIKNNIGRSHPPRSQEYKDKVSKIHTGKKNPKGKSIIVKAYNKLKTPVVMLDKDWNEINRFDSMKDASDFSGAMIAAICRSCKKGGNSIAKGFRFKYSDFNINKCDSIHQISPFTNEIIKTWNTVKEAVEYTGITRANITQVANGSYLTAGGFIWRYANEEYNKIYGPDRLDKAS